MKPGPKPFEGFALFLLTLALGLGTFIQVLDISIANVSIPNISGDLGVSSTQGTWIITSFSVSNAIVLPLTGVLARHFGEVRLFVWSTGLFSFMSWLCGLAWNLPVLILFRVLQGAVAGALIPLSQSLLIQNYPEEKKNLAIGLWSTIVIIAPVLGPVLGGWITDEYGWPWIFYINVPLGLFSTLVSWRMLKGRESEIKKLPIDFVGFALIAFGVGALQIALDKGQELDWFNSDVIIALSICATVGLTYFIGWELYTENPAVELSFFKGRNFRVSTILSSVAFLIFFAGLVLLPLWLQTRMGYTAFWAGISIMPTGLIPVFFSPYVGKSLQKFDARILASLSYVLLAISFYWLSTFTTSVSLQQIMLARLFQGLGLMLFFIPMLALALSEIAPTSIASASGIFNFSRLIAGGGFGTALAVTLWNRREIFHHSQLIESVNASNLNTSQFFKILEGLQISGDPAKQVVDNIVLQEASMLAINDVFYLCAWIYLFLVPFVWLCRRPKVVGAHAASE